MSRNPSALPSQPFPAYCPAVDIHPIDAESFAVDCRELPGWFAIPDVGDVTLWSIYDPPDWHLASVTAMVGVRPAWVHDLQSVETEASEWEPGTGWQPGTWLMFARATEDRVEWLGHCRLMAGKRVLATFLDEGFEADWGGAPRHLADERRLVPNPNGTHRLVKALVPVVHDVFGAGLFRVQIGERSFTCLRVLSLTGEPSEEGILYVSFVTQDGRTILGRRFNGRQWGHGSGDQPPWDERLPGHERIVIDDVTYVHWYDCLSHLACGIEAGAWRG